MADYEKKVIETITCPAEGCLDPSRVKKDGFHGGKQRYECNSCGKKFKADGKALHRQYTAKQIAAGIDKHLSGMSYKEVCEHLEDFYGVPRPSKHTTHDWVKGYGRLAQDFLEGKVGPDGRPETASGKHIKADVGDVWVADETYIRAGGQWRYCWNIMDAKTRYILAVYFSQNRGPRQAIIVIKKALAAAKNPPKKLISDGLGGYAEAVKAVLPPGTVHEVSKGIREEINNNMSERLQGSIKDRSKTQRGFQEVRTGHDCLEAWAIDYNFFKSHSALGGRTPAEVAGVASQVPWGDSWEDITRIGGEVAEPELKVVETKRKQYPPRTTPMSLVEAAEKYQEDKKYEDARAKRRSRNIAPVASYPRRPKWTTQGGRGKKGIRI